MISFELRDVNRINFVETEEAGVKKIIFTVVAVVGIVGNTYPSFVATTPFITVTCNKSQTGDQMETDVQTACTDYVTANYPPIN